MQNGLNSCWYPFHTAYTDASRIEWEFLVTVCPGSSYLFYIVTYYIKWVTTFGQTVYDQIQSMIFSLQKLKY